MSGRNFLPIHSSKKRLAGDSSDWTRALKMSALGVVNTRDNQAQHDSGILPYLSLGRNIRGAIERFKANVPEPILVPEPEEPPPPPPPQPGVIGTIVAAWIAGATITAGAIGSAAAFVASKVTGGYLMAFDVLANTDGSVGPYSVQKRAVAVVKMTDAGGMDAGPRIESGNLVSSAGIVADASGRSITYGIFLDDVTSGGLLGEVADGMYGGFVTAHSGVAAEYLDVFNLGSSDSIISAATDGQSVYVVDSHTANDDPTAGVTRISIAGTTPTPLQNAADMASFTMVKLDGSGAVAWATRFEGGITVGGADVGPSVASVFTGALHVGAPAIIDNSSNSTVPDVGLLDPFVLVTRYSKATGAPTGYFAVGGTTLLAFAPTILVASDASLWVSVIHGEGTMQVLGAVGTSVLALQGESEATYGTTVFEVETSTMLATSRMLHFSDGNTVPVEMCIETSTGNLIATGQFLTETMTVTAGGVDPVTTLTGAMGIIKKFAIVLAPDLTVLKQDIFETDTVFARRSETGLVGSVVQVGKNVTFGATSYEGTDNGALTFKMALA